MSRGILIVLVVAAFAAVASAHLFKHRTTTDAAPTTNSPPTGLCQIQVPASDRFTPSGSANKWFAIGYNTANKQDAEMMSALGLMDEENMVEVDELDQYGNKSAGCGTYTVQVSRKTLTIKATYTNPDGKSFTNTITLKQVGNSNAVYQGKTRSKNGNALLQITIFDTDNKNYLIWNACAKVTKKDSRKPQQFQGITILSLTKTLPKPQVQKLEQKIVGLGFDKSTFRTVDNSQCKRED